MSLIGGVLVAMWNYMGWDNASTVAQEVERPQRTYPRAMIAAVVLVTITYVLPFVAVRLAGIPASAFEAEGAWATVAGVIGGKILGIEWLRVLIVIGGMMSAFGMFNALVMSYSRLPLAMARDGMLPKIFAKTSDEDASAVGGDPGVRRMLGAMPGIEIREAGYAGHYVVRSQLDAGVCDAGGSAHSRAGVEARVPGTRRAGRGG